MSLDGTDARNPPARLVGVTLLIFDVGGVLRDSRLALDAAYSRAFRTSGFAYPFLAEDTWHLRGIGKYFNSINMFKALLAFSRSKTNLEDVIGRSDAETLIDGLIAKSSLPDNAEIIATMLDTYKASFTSDEAKPLVMPVRGSEEGVLVLKARGYKLAIFSNSSRSTLSRDISYLSAFDAVLSSDDVSRKKPSGEGIVKICNRLGVAPEKSAYIGDVPDDVTASKDAGCHAIAVLSGMGLEIYLKASKPDLICQDVLDLSSRLIGTGAGV